ncbi:DUF4435 domain-containing protein [Agarivorans aestuarii]|uniref:DUF4435 domain-containing protein n=1 Tax=Agarivorans aestuarii TaxID=1563703 RepID=A0ABU7G3Z2_9ALTE|nr:DUF4435 domain-containing protein [Agarivorans aestuarii]MEE1673931.1 DUF4435 domain-containing protein [Agarivorans aestuarii]
MIHERSVQAKAAKSVFFEDVNDIDIYIEDTAFGYPKLFTILFSRLLNQQYKVNRVFPLGGRKAVIEQHSEHSSDRPSLYIIDGDLFLLIGDEINNQKGLYKFPHYCVENILCDQNAILAVLDEEEPVKSLGTLEGLFNYQEWLLNNEDKLFCLFVEYATSMILTPQQQTVAFKVSDLVSNNKGELDDHKLETRVEGLKQLIIESKSIEEYESTRNEILANFERSGLNKLDVISGKDYLFPLLKTRAKSLVKTKVPDLNLKLRLAKTCNVHSISAAVDYIAC